MDIPIECPHCKRISFATMEQLSRLQNGSDDENVEFHAGADEVLSAVFAPEPEPEHDEITIMSGRVCRGGTCD